MTKSTTAQAEKKYVVTIKGAMGECNSELFKKMALNGDITAEKVPDNVGLVFKLTGMAECHIESDEKEFDVTYYATPEGYLSTGSIIFKDSVIDYMDYTDTFKIQAIKTKKGTSYKAVPISKSEPTEEE